MWTVGIRTLRRLYIPWALRGTGAWAGHRLIITGDYSDRYPEGVFTGPELAIMNNVSYDERDDEGFFTPLLRLAGGVTTDYKGCTAEDKLQSRLVERVGVHRWFYHRTPEWMDKFLPWTKPADENSLEFPTDPVLRNLTKKEYIRADAFTLSRGYHVCSANNPVTLGYAVMSRIVWSADWSVPMNLSVDFATKLFHGPWTGCAFDIIGFGEWTDRDGWNDVSAEAKEDLIYMGLQEGAIS